MSLEPVLDHVTYDAEDVKGAAAKRVENSDVLRTIQEKLTNQKTFKVTNEFFGSDPCPGVRKICRVFWKDTPNRPVVSCSGIEGAYVNFSGYVTKIYWGGKLISDAAVYESVNRALIKGLAHPEVRVTINNELMGCDPKPGEKKFATLNIRDLEWKGGNREITVEEHDAWPGEGSAWNDAVASLKQAWGQIF